MTKILVFDPSGNFKEGKGTTGFCVMEDGELIQIGTIKASEFKEDVGYWFEHLDLFEYIHPDILVMEGYRLYNHKGMKASTQANSELETPQLIGAIKVKCFEYKIPYHIQFAAEVKSRWSDDVLVALNILEKKGNRLYLNGRVTNNHERDALRHGFHFWRYYNGNKKK